MRICPQCRDAYSEDYIFCMNDGTRLLDESGEQETVVGRRVKMPATSALSPDALTTCSSCGLTNRANSKFCKKCGGKLFGSSAESVKAVSGGNPFESLYSSNSEEFAQARVGPKYDNRPASSASEQTIAFQPPIFTPPAQDAQTSGKSITSQQMYIGVMAAIVTILVIGWAIVNSKQTDKTSNSSNSAAADNASNRPVVVANGNTGTVSAYNPAIRVDSSVVGHQGYLTQNTNIRSASNRSAETRGTHYQGAKVRILNVDSYPTQDGVSTWYQVEVLQDGCDSQGAFGCGNNWERNGYFGWMEAEKVGWMNAKYISLN